MAKSSAHSAYRCSECGWQATKWVGRCGECQAWGTIEEAGVPRLVRAGVRGVGPGPVSTPAVPIGDVDARAASARPTGMDELDRVLGGGLVPGAVLLLAGEPGVGKSTLLLEAAALVAGSRRVLYVTGKESAAPGRPGIGPVSDTLYRAAETDLSAVLGHVETVRPDLLVIDSVQTISAGGVDGAPGGGTPGRGGGGPLLGAGKGRSPAHVP